MHTYLEKGRSFGETEDRSGMRVPALESNSYGRAGDSFAEFGLNLTLKKWQTPV